MKSNIKKNTKEILERFLNNNFSLKENREHYWQTPLPTE
jgi:hypothetical protein